MEPKQKLSLTEFKAIAVTIDTEDALEKVKGGTMSDCHGYSQWVKSQMPLPSWW